MVLGSWGALVLVREGLTVNCSFAKKAGGRWNESFSCWIGLLDFGIVVLSTRTVYFYIFLHYLTLPYLGTHLLCTLGDTLPTLRRYQGSRK